MDFDEIKEFEILKLWVIAYILVLAAMKELSLDLKFHK